ncbi:MAG: alkaline phosphatase family protein [Gemmatimonadaceae bacterium]|nr:alkaline phosphatase family protein [Acetobacteraceae bacterium]
MAAKNVLLIVVDQWRADCVPHLGTPHLRTPNLDRLCREGVTFRNHVTTCVPCGPARASLLTGLYLMNHRAVQNTVPLDARHTTLPRALRNTGYDPALVGYTTTTPDPRTTGPADPRFSVLGDNMEGWRCVGAFEPDHDGYFGWLAQRGYTLPPNRDDIWLPDHETSRGATTHPARIPAHLSDTAFFTDRALTYLKGLNGKPFFLHLGYYRPHPPFVASAPYHAMYDAADMPGPVRAASPEIEAQQHPLLGWYLDHTHQQKFFQGAEGMAAGMDEATVRQLRATYYGMMTEIDDNLGQVFTHLDATGQWDDTLIVFTSDHGEQLGDHHLLGKVGYFDESFRIPLVIKAPGNQRAGAIEDAFTESVDVMPTILDWLGGAIPRACDGASLLPFLDGPGPADWRDALHYEYDFRDIHYSQPERDLGIGMDESSLCVIQDAAWKYVHFAALPPLLFDLVADPHQLRNLAADPAHAATVRDYAQRALSWRMRHADRTLTHYRSTPAGLETREPTR